MRTRWAAAAIGIALALGACSDSTSPVAQEQPASSASASSAAAPGPPFEVTRRDVVLEDTSRPTDAVPERGLKAKPSRTLPTAVLIPDGDGPFPIVEWSHAHGGTGTGGRRDFLEAIAAQGYIVVAPTFPLSSGPNGTFADYSNQPGDAYFAIDAVAKMGEDPADPLYGRVDADRIALTGHSLGAMTTIGAAYNSCCARPTVDAAISFAAVEAGFPNGDFTNRPPTPLLLVHGDKDTTLPVDGSVGLFANATGPVAFLRFPEGFHSGILTSADGELSEAAAIAWLDRWLRDDPTKLDKLQAEVDESGIATLQTRGL